MNSLFSGGILCAVCPHGIVYGLKFLLRGESPRDHVDMLLSFSHMPTLSVCDIPSFVARHGNNRRPNLFSPHFGRFAAPTEQNIAKSKTGTLTVSIPELDMEHLMYRTFNQDIDHPYAKKKHPLTRTDAHYVGYDRFHQENSSNNEEKLRQLDIVPQCRGINTQVVEELFSSIGRSTYFLTQLSPLHHVFMIRLILNLWNQRHNEARIQHIERQVSKMQGCSTHYDTDERLIVSVRQPREYCI